MARTHPNLTAIVAVALLAFPGAATAADAVDPESPSGYEYAIPLERARESADPARLGGPADGAPDGPPPFGAGVVPPPAAGSAAGDRGGAHAGGRGEERRREERDRAEEPPEHLAAEVPTPSAEAGDLALLGAAAGGVLLIGALGGMALRRRRG